MRYVMRSEPHESSQLTQLLNKIGKLWLFLTCTPDYHLFLHSPEWARTEAAAIGSPALRKNPMLFCLKPTQMMILNVPSLLSVKPTYVNNWPEQKKVLGKAWFLGSPANFELPAR